MTGLLASICSVEEADIALHSYVDIIDCKDPTRGALGALDLDLIASIVDFVNGERPVSATIGDLPADPKRIRHAVRNTADCGVDYIKLGLFEETTAAPCIMALKEECKHNQLIAVCFADLFDPMPLLPLLSTQGFHGVMIDTAEKKSGRLTELWSLTHLARFIDQAQLLGLVCGLAGRLTLDAIPSLLPLQADYLGFRSALCVSDRTSQLDHRAVMRARNAMPFGFDVPTINTAFVAVH
ncbi:MAG: (5-formylfuran-3-yl)methyl phosphate synthase [Sedimenticola sp.]|nr:(5-formylfuran-3-yl)methyl phosphate synthase [Sedimenticola sp.]